jgi:hypothetical protein
MVYLCVEAALVSFLMADLLEWPSDLCTCLEADQKYRPLLCKSPLHLGLIYLPSINFWALRFDHFGSALGWTGLIGRGTGLTGRTWAAGRLESREELACPPSPEALMVIFGDSFPSGVFSSTTSMARIFSYEVFGLSSPMITFLPLAPSACFCRISTLALFRSMV